MVPALKTEHQLPFLLEHLMMHELSSYLTWLQYVPLDNFSRCWIGQTVLYSEDLRLKYVRVHSHGFKVFRSTPIYPCSFAGLWSISVPFYGVWSRRKYIVTYSWFICPTGFFCSVLWRILSLSSYKWNEILWNK